VVKLVLAVDPPFEGIETETLAPLTKFEFASLAVACKIVTALPFAVIDDGEPALTAKTTLVTAPGVNVRLALPDLPFELAE
jgi:hypothetical protein